MHKDLQLWDITSRWEGENKTKKVIAAGSEWTSCDLNTLKNTGLQGFT